MEVIRINHKHIPLDLPDCVGCIGYFDGFHKGHRTLMEKAKSIAKENNLKSAIITFDPDPWTVFKPGVPLKHLMSLLDKIEFAKNNHVDTFYMITFTKGFASLSTDEFHQVLNSMHVKTLVCGFDFKYGYKNSGNTQSLLDQDFFDVQVIESVNDSNKKISSSRIEPLIEEGHVDVASHLLGYIYSIHGKIVHGFKRGSKLLQIPTANLQCDDEYILPKVGVYAGACEVDGIIYLAMINVGSNPTFENDLVTIEANLIDFNQDIYGKHARFFFYKLIREEQKFSSIEALKTQLLHDIETTRTIMNEQKEFLQITAKTWDKKLFDD